MSQMPAWLEALVGVVADAMTAHGMPGGLGVRYREDEGAWEVLAYQLPVELLGGRHDGAVVSPGFSLDREAVRSAFPRVDDLSWQAQPMGDRDDGPCVRIEGDYAGRQVWLRVLAYAPDDEEPETKFYANRR
jgi:hypothetical protein